jgi:hypothetical protein
LLLYLAYSSLFFLVNQALLVSFPIPPLTRRITPTWHSYNACSTLARHFHRVTGRPCSTTTHQHHALHDRRSRDPVSLRLHLSR